MQLFHQLLTFFEQLWTVFRPSTNLEVLASWLILVVCKLIMIREIWLAQEADFVHIRAVKGNCYEEASKAVSRSALWLTVVSARLVVGLDWVLWLGPLCPCVKEIDKNYTSCHFQTLLKSSVCEHPSVFVYFVFYILSLHFPGALAPLSESVCVCMY